MSEASLKIGEVARRTWLSVRTLRQYDELGLLVPSERTYGVHRLHSSDDFRRLLAVQHLKSLGLSLTEVKAALDDPGFDAAEALADHITTVEHRLTAEQERTTPHAWLSVSSIDRRQSRIFAVQSSD